MGLSSVIQKAAAAAFAAVGDLKGVGTYHFAGTSVYDTDTGAVTESGGRNISNVDLVLTKYSSREIDGEVILATDRKAIVLQSALGTLVPKTTDSIMISGVSWKIVSIGQDAAGATWIFQLRRP